jgi:hypothetical protein
MNFSLIFFKIFSDFLLEEQSLYLDLLRKEIHQKSIQNLIMYLDEVHEYFLRFFWGFSQISCSESNPLAS